MPGIAAAVEAGQDQDLIDRRNVHDAVWEAVHRRASDIVFDHLILKRIFDDPRESRIQFLQELYAHPRR
jgi:hypothetical protein